MAVEVGIRDFRSRLRYWLNCVAAGEELLVTDRGKPHVRVVGACAPTNWERLVEQGVITPAKKPKKPIDFTGLPRLEGHPNLSDIVIAQRRGRDY